MGEYYSRWIADKVPPLVREAQARDPCLRALGIRQRGLYAMKDTYISTALTAGVNISWLEAQTGVRYETLKRHDGKWLRMEGADQLENSPGWPPA